MLHRSSPRRCSLQVSPRPGMGLFFVVAVAARALVDPSLRSRALAVVPPLVVYLVWFALVGRGAVGDTGPRRRRSARRDVRGSGNHIRDRAVLRPPSSAGGIPVGSPAASSARGGNRLEERPRAPTSCLSRWAACSASSRCTRSSPSVRASLRLRLYERQPIRLRRGLPSSSSRSWTWFRGETRGHSVARRAGVGGGVALARRPRAVDRGQRRRDGNFTLRASVQGGHHARVHRVGRGTCVMSRGSTRALSSGRCRQYPELLDIVSRHGSPLEDELVPDVVRPAGRIGARRQRCSQSSVTGSA